MIWYFLLMKEKQKTFALKEPISWLLKESRKLNWLSCYFMVLWFTYYTYLFDFWVWVFLCGVQVLCIFLVPAWILGESNCHQFSWHWALIGSFHFPPYSSDIWLVFRPYLGIRIESFNNVCWPIKKVCWPTRNQLLCFCSLSGWKLQILTMLFANWLPQIYHAQPFLATFKANAPI